MNTMIMILLAFTFALLFTAGYLSGHIAMPIFIGYAAMSALTFILFGIDKYAAVNNRNRIPESKLHLFALLGGWPGALFAQPIFRHKTRKQSFQIPFWLMTAVNISLLSTLIYLI